jgi:hypothetical protein
MPVTDRPYRYALLASLLEPWRREVLARFAPVNERRHRALRCGRAFRHAHLRALRYGARRLGEVLEDCIYYAAHPDHRPDDLFCAFQDFLNVYGRLLHNHGVLADRTPASPDHDYYELRRRFILRAMQQVSE